MKKFILFAVVMLMASPALALIANSAHDFPTTLGVGVGDSTEICVYCHTPHGADSVGPLWNRNTGAVNLSGVYSSSTLDATMNNDYTQIDAQLCMGCHDGVQDINALLNPPNTGTAISYTLSGTKMLDATMANDHPVNFIYTDSATDTEIVAIGSLPAAVTSFGAGNRMQCSNCHDVHNTAVGGGNLLVIANDGSNLCFACHIK